jgi:putative ABC transport system ATP-binding protein
MSEIVRPEPLVELRSVSKHFGEGETRVDALVDVSLSVFPGEVVGMVGPSGSGKSTLLAVIGCVTEPSSGWMHLNGEVVYDKRWLRRDLRRLRLEKVGFIFQTHNLLPFLTATENVMEVMELAGASSGDARQRAADLLEYLEIGRRRNAMPSALSGGEAQRVAIARALANGPRIILADEPTAPLDSQRAGVVMDLLRRLASDQQASIIVVTHDEGLFGRFDRIFHLRDGRLVSIDGVPPSAAGTPD